MISSSLLLISLCLFILGAIVGSFLNVLIERSIAGQDWIHGRSRCDVCSHQLAWYDNIPLLSFTLLRGRCRYCHQPIGLSHIVLELLTAGLFLWWFWGGFFLLNVFQLNKQPFVVVQPFFWLLVAVILLVIMIYDIKYLIIPDEAVWFLTSVTLIYRFALVAMGIMQSVDLVKSILIMAAAMAFLILLWLITLSRGLGLGDIKLIVPLSLLVGWQLTLVGVALSFFIGAVIGLILLFLGRAKLGRPIAFGPFLILGFTLALMWGDRLLSWYLPMLR